MLIKIKSKFLNGRFSFFLTGVFLIFSFIFSFLYYRQMTKDTFYQIFDIAKTFSWKDSPEGIYRTDAKGDLDSILLSSDRWRDFSLSILLIHPRDCAVVFHYQDPNHFYFLYFDQNDRSIIWAAVREGGASLIKKISWPFTIQQFPLTLEVKGDRARLYAFGRFFSEISVAHPEGKIGLMLKDASFPKTIFTQIAVSGYTSHGHFKEVRKDAHHSWSYKHLLALLFLCFSLLALSGYLAFAVSRCLFRSLSFPGDDNFGKNLNLSCPLAIHLLIAVALFWPFVFKGEVLVSSTDNFGEIFPLFFYCKHLFWQILKGESLGLWNPYVHNGVPFFSNHWNMIYYPLNWIVFLFADKDVMSVLTFRTFVEVFLIGVFAYKIFVRELQSKSWALFCSVVYQMCSLLIFCLTVFPSIDLYFALTLYFYFLWTMTARRALANYFWLSFSLVLIFTSANMVFIFYAMLSLLAATLYRFWFPEPVKRRRAFLEAGVVLGAVASALLISAVRLIPCAIGIMESNRIVHNYYTLHDRLFLWIRLLVPEIVSGFDLNPLTSPHTNIIFQSIDMPSNPQNTFFVYFGVLPALLLLLNFLTPTKGAHRFWKIYALITLAIALLFQPVWGILSILFFPLVHYSYHIIILPLGLCMLFGYTGMSLEKQKFSLRKVAPNFIGILLLAQALMAIIITYMLPQLTVYTRMIFMGMILWYGVYRFLHRRMPRLGHRYLSGSVLFWEGLLFVVLFLLMTIVMIKPIPRKEDITQNIMVPALFLLSIGLLSIRVYMNFFRNALWRWERGIRWCISVTAIAVVAWGLISSTGFRQLINNHEALRNYFVDFTIGQLRFWLVLGSALSLFILFRIRVLSAEKMIKFFIMLTILDLFIFNAHFDSVVAPAPHNRAFYPSSVPYREMDDYGRANLDLVNYRCNHLEEAGLFANKNLIFEVPSYTGIIGYMPKRFSELVKSFGYPPTTVLIYPKDSTDDDRFLDLSAVRYDFTEKEGVVERPNALSRLSLLYAHRVIEDDGRLLKELHSPSFNPQQEILLSQPPFEEAPLLRVRDAQMVPIEKASNDFIETQLKVTAPAWLLFSESFHPGWKATIDGREAPVYLANYNFMACFVPSGEHRVHFEFKPAGFYYSGKISLAGLGIFGGVLLFGLVLRYRKRVMV